MDLVPQVAIVHLPRLKQVQLKIRDDGLRVAGEIDVKLGRADLRTNAHERIRELTEANLHLYSRVGFARMRRRPITVVVVRDEYTIGSVGIDVNCIVNTKVYVILHHFVRLNKQWAVVDVAKALVIGIDIVPQGSVVDLS